LSNEALNATLSTRLDGLTLEIHQALQVLSQKPEGGDSRVMSNLDACVRSAGEVVTSATTIVEARSVDGSQANWEEWNDRVMTWIPDPAISDAPSTSPLTDNTGSSSPSGFFSDHATTVTSLSPTSERDEPRYDKYAVGICAETFPQVLPFNTSETITLKNPVIPNITETTLSEPPPAEVGQDVHDSDTDTDQDLIKAWRKSGMMKLGERNYEGAEILLEKALAQSELKHGTQFPERATLLGSLVLTRAYQGKREKVEKVLDNNPADWNNVLEVLVSSCLEEGKCNPAIEILTKYGSQFEGRDDSLVRLVSTCLKHGSWPVAAYIVGRYPFHGKEKMLELCLSACRARAKWDAAEGFLLELLKDNEHHAWLHSLTEVYLEKGDRKSAQRFCKRAIDARKRLKHPLYHDSIYLMAKIIYEANGDLIEYNLYKNILPPKVQGTPLELLM
jgi:tetratricopeptide (TPR) repeat protein